MFNILKSMATKKPAKVKPKLVEKEVQKDIPTTQARVVTIDSVVDGKLTKIEGYLTDIPVNESSKVIRWQDEGEYATNKFFTKK